MKQNRKEILKTIFKLFLTRHYEDVSYDDMIKATNIPRVAYIIMRLIKLNFSGWL